MENILGFLLDWMEVICFVGYIIVEKIYIVCGYLEKVVCEGLGVEVE